MTNKHKLRGKNIYIDDDLTQNEREIQRIIRKKAKEERTKGKNVKIGYQKLFIENEAWAWNRTTAELQISKNWEKGNVQKTSKK